MFLFGFIIVRVPINIIVFSVWLWAPWAQAQPMHPPLIEVPNITYEVVAVKPGNKQAYTQGLQLVDDVLYWGTGKYGQSEIRALDWKTGRIKLQHKLPKEAFGEGIAVWNEHIYQLTWKIGLLYIYRQSDLSLADIFVYTGEGWGLTHDGKQFIMSDGTATLTFRNSDTFVVEREIQVTNQGKAIDHINELEGHTKRRTNPGVL